MVIDSMLMCHEYSYCQMPHESTVDHDGSELSADDEGDSPIAVAMDTSSANYLSSLMSPSNVPHVPHVRPLTPREVTHHHDDDDDDDDVDDDDVDVADENEDAKIVVNGNVIAN